MSFLTAEWRKLILINYAVDPTLLSSFIPAGTELDLYHGNCFISLVGFQFVDVRLLGLRIPWHTNFEEVNLRFYVKRYEKGIWKRGVVFVKELVPKPGLTFVANTIYKENYETVPMHHRWEITEDTQYIEYSWNKSNRQHSISVTAGVNPNSIIRNSESEFITEHYWGYARVNDRKTNEYEVTHPIWDTYDVHSFQVNCDFSAVYGPNFGVLNQQSPHSVLLAEGSKITVESKRSIPGLEGNM